MNCRGIGGKAVMAVSRRGCKRRGRLSERFVIDVRYRLSIAVLLQCLALLIFSPAARAEPNHIAAELIAEAPTAPGQPATLAIHMRPAPGWHGYWANPGDAGLGMALKWQLPPGATAGEPRYPVPHTLLVSGLMNHVFEQDYAVLIPLTLPAGTSRGQAIPITLEADWLACTDKICVPERATMQTTLTLGAAASDPRFDRWRAALPAPLGSAATFALSDGRLRIGIPLPASAALDRPHFFAAEDKLIDYAAPQRFLRQGDMLVVELARAKFAAATPLAVSGVLRLGQGDDGLIITAAPGPVPAGGTPLPSGPPAEIAALPLLLLGALAGGLLLNIMPCVFPILSLKALSLARAGESEAEARIEGLAYTAGVIAACSALGALLLALRAGGSEIGWAFQLQEPLVVAALLALAAAITANLLGAFEFSVPGFANRNAPQGAFATGLLAAFVATPCTGPFMAAALGAALLLPVIEAMALFAALGLGIALPFLALAFVPALRRRLPKPGAWMVTFRRWMALPMGLTALALVWLASRLGGASFALACAVLAAALAGLLIAAGRLQRQGKSASALILGGVAALGLLGAIGLPRSITPPGASVDGIIATRPFSEAALTEAQSGGKPVFLWFTADWCLTCKVNERVAIEREDVRDAFAAGGVTVLRGDWTRRDPAITRYLTEQGAAGVPLYVWYPAGISQPQVLPQVLSADLLIGRAGGK